MEKAFVLELSESKFKDLFVCFCGYAQCEPLHSFGPAVRPNYLIHYIIEGKGLYQVGEHKYHLEAGEGFLIEPDALTYYQADQQEPWSYLWIGFSGRRAGEYLQDLGLNSRQLTFRSGQGKELKRLVLRMMRCSDGSVSSQYQVQSLLYAFFAALSQGAAGAGAQEQSRENFYVERAIGYIRNEYSSDMGVVEIANYLGISRSHLYKLFKSSLQMSPQEFLTRFRISRARELLTTTQLSVEQVALSCGYQNTLVFSKAFKRSIGCPPTEFRTEHRKTVRKNREENQEMLQTLMEDEELRKLQKKTD